MADLVEVALTVAGWIIAGLATAWGVRYAHRKEVESQRDHEDSVGIFHPLREEMEAILEEAPRLTSGGSLWSRSKAYTDLVHRGVLQPARHESLHDEIKQLETLHKKHISACKEFYDARVAAVTSVLRKGEVEVLSGGNMKPLLGVMPSAAEDQQLQSALAGDQAQWLNRFKRIQEEVDLPGYHPGEVHWRKLKPSIQEMFAEAASLTSDSRAAYQSSANELVAQAKKIRDLLDEAIRKAA